MGMDHNHDNNHNLNLASYKIIIKTSYDYAKIYQLMLKANHHISLFVQELVNENIIMQIINFISWRTESWIYEVYD